MSVLVAYATHSGATRTLAETIARTLGDEGFEVALLDVEEAPDPSAHDALVLGSAVRVESIEKSAVAWMDRHASAVAERPFAFFSCSGSASDPAKGGRQKATDVFLDRLDATPVAVKNFPGWVIMEKIPLHERVLLRSLRTPIGDFRDLPAVAAWAREIAPLLTA
ncbi:flavodoxin domain-containing protein [Brachybacterium sp. FME24]|uniref:flavodoxin domain-containing protein n=1 Tax=Brachybacterium sp. FME24 TaxID=2742605 RepID=UPI001865EBF6|nr:flavodoxin domain-containing protein [Brachybacterium sp. FME24]